MEEIRCVSFSDTRTFVQPKKNQKERLRKWRIQKLCNMKKNIYGWRHGVGEPNYSSSRMEASGTKSEN
jgi:hypothetical protein